MIAAALKQPSAWLPIAMSFAALALVIGHIVTVGVAREADEGTAARLWQLLMAGQIPVIAFFAIEWLPRRPRLALGVLALQAAAVVAAAAPVFLLESSRRASAMNERPRDDAAIVSGRYSGLPRRPRATSGAPPTCARLQLKSEPSGLPRDERWESINLRALSLAAQAIAVILVGAFLVAQFGGADSTPYAWLGVVFALVYLGGLVWYRAH